MIFPVGQESIADFFKSQIAKGRLGHAYMLCGDEGMGKKTLCNYLLKLIMCHTNTACGVCNGCSTVESGANPDIIYVTRGDKASIQVDAVRKAISEIYIKPLISDKKVIVIHDAHLMTKGAQNALLKAIEEPPSYVVFFLLCDSVSPILPTIISRVSKIDIPPLDVSTLKQIVPGCMDFMYRYCQGNPGRLIKLSQDEEFAKLRDTAVAVAMTIADDDEYSIYSYESMFSDREQTARLYDLIAMFVRDVLLIKNSVDDLVVNKDKINDIKAFSSLVTARDCARLTEIIINARIELGKSGSVAMSWQAMIVKCREVIHDRSSRNTF